MSHSITRRQFVERTAGAASALAAACSPAPAPGQRPNIILLMGDDHGWDETGYNGHPHVLTPVLDEMAATGLRMDPLLLGLPGLLADARQRAHGPPSESLRHFHSQLVDSARGDQHRQHTRQSRLCLRSFR